MVGLFYWYDLNDPERNGYSLENDKDETLIWREGPTAEQECIDFAKEHNIKFFRG